MRTTFARHSAKRCWQREQDSSGFSSVWSLRDKSGIMMEKLRMFRLLLYKNYLVRKRHWKMGLLVEILIPLLLFVLIQACRDFSAAEPIVHENNTYYEIKTKEHLISKISYRTTIYFAPENRFTRILMEKTRGCLKFPAGTITGFNSEEELLKMYALYQTQDPINDIIAVIFDEKYANISSKHLSYTIRTAYVLPNILYTIDTEGPTLDQALIEVIPFLQLQLCLDESFIKMKARSPSFKSEVSIQQMPYPPYVQLNENDMITRILFCGFAVIAFLIPLCVEATYAADEKFIGINVLMAMNGVPTYLNLLSWLVSGLIFSVSYVSALIILFNISFTDNVHPYIYYGNSFIFWLVLILHVGHLITFGMHISAYFSKSLFMISGILALYGGSSMIQKYSIKGDYYAVVPYLGIFFPNILLFRAFQEVNNYESMLKGIKWSNLFLVGDPVYKTAGSLGMIMIFSIIGTVFHFLITVYIYAVHPGKYGVKKHPLYFLKTKNKVNSDDEMDDYEFDDVDGKPFETIPRAAFTPGIQIRGLKKEFRTHLFSKSKVQALRGISVDFYKGQITALLGHNGAGKTTLMSILTGMISPSDGAVYINGKNVKEQSNVLMNDIGLCPQEDMLFPTLSVAEQIEFFGMLKGKNKSKAAIKHDVNTLLKKLKLFDKRNAMPNQLSGGQKRRVCLGMAVIGDSSTLILDEPTSGMDPESRRDTWDIILRMRGQKTIIISTHDMEEADILGDRIAIVHMGRLKSYGSSMFLKKLLGQGNIEVTLSTESWCDPQRIRNELDSRGQILNIDGGKIVLSVPNSPELPDYLDKIEMQKKDLGVTGMSVSLITLEQVFLKVTRDNEDATDSCQPFLDSTYKLKGQALLIQSVFALLKKKVRYTRRNLVTISLIILLPIICILFMTMDYNISNDTTTLIPIKLDMYSQPQTYYGTSNKLVGEKYKLTTEEFYGKATEVPKTTSLTDALLEFGRTDEATYRNNLIAAVEFNNTDNDTLTANAFYSGYAMFSIPISVNLLSNALLKSHAGDEYSISLSGHQLPHSIHATAIPEVNIDAYATVLLFVFFLFPAVALFVIHPLRESLSNVKQLQRMTGVSCFTYWGTMFAFDFLVFLVAILCIVVGFICMDNVIGLRMYEKSEIGITILLLLLFAVNTLPLIYICSFLKKSTSTVITLLSLLPFGLVSLELIMHVITISLHSHGIVQKFRSIQKGIFLLIPYLSFFHGEVSFFSIASKNARCRRLPNVLHEVACLAKDSCCGLDCFDGKCKKSLRYFNNFNEDMSLEQCVTYLSVTPFFYFAILAVLEYKLIPLMLARMRKGKYEILEDPCDEQVKKEKHSVASEIVKANIRCTLADSKQVNRQANKIKTEANGNATLDESNTLSNDNANNYLFFVYELSKRYGNLTAVEEISFGVKQHECFGLLGVNGAGKSTTFKMMTGQSIPNNGCMYLGDRNFNDNRRYYLSQMGYCPQNDAIIRCLNASEHLALFARLRGIPESQVNNEVKKWIDRLNLNICASQPSGTYSGGNKRRLNIAMALIGNPSLVLLDEPTTGVDPAARRSLWNVIQSCQTTGQAIILTSHSMEECEALCNRLVIMVNGQLVCIGPCQELKQRFGAGYDIQMKLNPEKSSSQMESIKRDIEQALNCELVDENSGFLMYHVTTSETTWRRMYDVMTELKNKYNCIDDFSVLSSTLEQLFLLFARAAKRSNRKAYK